MLNKNRLGNSDLYVSEIGLGCMSLGTEERTATDIVKRAIDLGINYFDTADLYDKGLNEQIVGKALKQQRSEIIIATKVGNRWEDGKEGWTWDPSKAYIKKAVKNSLHRLQTDYIDLYQLHGGTMEDHIDETIEAFEELKQEGVIRYYGISSIRPNVIKEYVKKSAINSVMMQYSILDRRPEGVVLDLLKDNNISVIARGPVAKGLLTNAYKDKLSSKGYLDYSNEELTKLLDQLGTKFADLSSIALHYCLKHPAVATVIPGASSIEQVEENIKSLTSSTLSNSEYEWIQNIAKASTYNQHN
ncbi:aldo/keto reductase [Sutcliffiella cohnii]